MGYGVMAMYEIDCSVQYNTRRPSVMIICVKSVRPDSNISTFDLISEPETVPQLKMLEYKFENKRLMLTNLKVRYKFKLLTSDCARRVALSR